MSALKAAAKRYWNSFPAVVYADDEQGAPRLRDFYRLHARGCPPPAASLGEEEGREPLPALYAYGPGWKGQWASFDVECLKWQAILLFHGVRFELRNWNEPLMSPKGDLPVVVADEASVLVPPFSTLRLQGPNSAHGELNLRVAVGDADDATDDMTAFLSLVESKLYLAVMYHFWCEPDNFSAVTESAYGSRYAWPLNKLIMWRRRSDLIKALFAKRPTLIRDEIYEEAAKALDALSVKLGDDDYFSRTSTPSTLDAAVFAYLHTTLSSPAPQRELPTLLSRFPKLVEFSKRVYNEWFSEIRPAIIGR